MHLTYIQEWLTSEPIQDTGILIETIFGILH
jgi:hypothetical protein